MLAIWGFRVVSQIRSEQVRPITRVSPVGEEVHHSPNLLFIVQIDVATVPKDIFILRRVEICAPFGLKLEILIANIGYR